MAFAYFIVHNKQGFFPIMNRGELAVLYCFVLPLFLGARIGNLECRCADQAR
jgi:putative oxidoreductase